MSAKLGTRTKRPTIVTLTFPDLTPKKAREFIASAFDNFEPQSDDPKWLRETMVLYHVNVEWARRST